MIDFEKWHGNGNDFVIINSIEVKTKINKNLITRISDRNKGIGFDQLINICLPTKETQFIVKISIFIVEILINGTLYNHIYTYISSFCRNCN